MGSTRHRYSLDNVSRVRLTGEYHIPWRSAGLLLQYLLVEAGHRHHAAVAFLLTRAKTGSSLLHLSECWPQVTLVTGPVETLLATPLVTGPPIGDGRWAGRGQDLVSRNHVIILLQLASLSSII